MVPTFVESQLKPISATATLRPRQGRLFEVEPAAEPNPWEKLNTRTLRLTKDQYGLVVKCYQHVCDSFASDPANVPFWTRVSTGLADSGLTIEPARLAGLIRRARINGIVTLPDPPKRTTTRASEKSKKLKTPRIPVRLSNEQHNAFARIYRDLQKEGFPKKRKKGQGFFLQAALRMKHEGHEFSSNSLSMYASYRRRIGDVNFPRLRGSHEGDRMHVAAVDRIQALGVMATGLMHEILQPLQVIMGEAAIQQDEAQRNSIDRDKLCVRMETIIRQVNKLSEVARHVRTIARAGEPKRELVSIRRAVDEALSLFMQQLRGKGIDVDLAGISEELPLVMADGVQLERIFINLISNARDAIEDTGRGEGRIQISGHATDRSVVCIVSDNGTGIVEENLPRIFDPYFTTKEVDKGTGMGLTEVMNLMILFGARVAVSSVPGQHTTFNLEFPRHVQA